MKCIHCNQEFKSKRKDQAFCSSKCRLKHFRDVKRINNETDNAVKSETDNITPVSTPKDRVLSPVVTDKDLKDYTAQDLYDAIDSYHYDAWIYSPEFKELKRRLDVWSVPKLESLGYRVPNWKFNEV